MPGASGVTIGGTKNATVSGNKVFKSYAAGIRVESWQSGLYTTQGSTTVNLTGNQVSDSPRDVPKEDHFPIMIFTNSGPISGVNVTSNKIVNPLNRSAVRVQSTSPGSVESVQVTSNTITDPAKRITNCVGLAGTITKTAVTQEANLLNDKPCTLTPKR